MEYKKFFEVIPDFFYHYSTWFSLSGLNVAYCHSFKFAAIALKFNGQINRCGQLTLRHGVADLMFG